MKRVIVIIIYVMLFSSIEAQPLRTLPASVENIFFENKKIYFQKIDTNIYKSISEKEKKQINKKNEYNIRIPINYKVFFIKDKDTMMIKLIYPIYNMLYPIFQKMEFQKGNYIIDLQKCVEEKKFNIKNFPCDCMEFKQEDD